ncbi:MAG TPA: hypothetical protein VFA97_04270 [Gaiellaceae bacterium]|nr:hypothetical protein [Gaiellaceae bacterium]
MTDSQLRTMFEAFAGAPTPGLRPIRRRATSRTLVIVLALVAVCGALVPASRAIVHAFETPKQFVSDTTQPARARTLIENYLAQQGGFRRVLTGVELELTAHTPDGRVTLYGLRFAGGAIGAADVGLGRNHVSGLWFGPPDACPRGWAIQARASFVASPGHTPVYVEGRVADTVAALDVAESDGRTYPVAIGNGYFLAWITPGPHAAKPSATLIARAADGAQIGAVYVGQKGAIPPSVAGTQPGCG